MHRAFVTKIFSRWLGKTPLTERAPCAAIAEISAGLVDASLGGHLCKKRVASPGRGKRGSARVLVGTNRRDRWFFLFGFEKNERDNISDRERVALQKLAAILLKQTSAELLCQLETGTLREICHEAKPHTH